MLFTMVLRLARRRLLKQMLLKVLIPSKNSKASRNRLQMIHLVQTMKKTRSQNQMQKLLTIKAKLQKERRRIQMSLVTSSPRKRDYNGPHLPKSPTIAIKIHVCYNYIYNTTNTRETENYKRSTVRL
jgi:hypothetical protein